MAKRTAKLLTRLAKEREIEGDDATSEDAYWAGEGNSASGILAVAKDTRRLCLAWRNEEVHTGDCWGLIGGAVKKGKEPGASAAAEMKEEVGYAGGVEIHDGYVFTDGDFHFFNFVGLVPNEFSFNPHKDHAWETDFIEWRTLEEWKEEMESNEGDFHPGVIAFFKNSAALIEGVVGDTFDKKPEVVTASLLTRRYRSKLSAEEIKPLDEAQSKGRFSIFMAGAIDQGKGENWQKKFADALVDYDVVLLNPRRDDWDASWEQSESNPEFVEQVLWEQRGLSNADFRIFVFLNDSEAPITLLELGENIGKPGMVCCEPKYYRKGNVDISAHINGMPVVESFDLLIEAVKKMLDEKGLKTKDAPKSKKSRFLSVKECREIGRAVISKRESETCGCGHGGGEHELFNEEACKHPECKCAHFRAVTASASSEIHNALIDWRTPVEGLTISLHDLEQGDPASATKLKELISAYSPNYSREDLASPEKQIRVWWILPDRFEFERGRREPNKVYQIAKAIEEGKRLAPAVFYRDEYYDGNHRVQAAVKLGLTKIPAVDLRDFMHDSPTSATEFDLKQEAAREEVREKSRIKVDGELDELYAALSDSSGGKTSGLLRRSAAPTVQSAMDLPVLDESVGVGWDGKEVRLSDVQPYASEFGIDWSGCDEVERVPGKVSGVPILKHSRVQADSVISNADSCSVEEVADMFELPIERVKAVVDYASRHRGDRAHSLRP